MLAVKLETENHPEFDDFFLRKYRRSQDLTDMHNNREGHLGVTQMYTYFEPKSEHNFFCWEVQSM